MEEADVRRLFGYNLKRIRKLKGISQQQLAEMVEMAFTFISDVENGKKWVSPESIAKFTAALSAEPYQFFLPQGFVATSDRNVEAFAQELSEAFATICARFLA